MILMRNTIYLILVMLFIENSPLLSHDNPYGLKTLNFKEYQISIKSNPNKELVDLEKTIPDLKLDIKYATPDNFTKQKIYTLAKAFTRKHVAFSLSKAQRDFKTLGYLIKIFDAYRPYSATVFFYELIQDTRYVASPKSGSRHNKGCALDLTLVDSKTLLEIKMPTEYDSFRKEAWPSTIIEDHKVRANRDLLITTMSKYGFQVNKSEWWHYDFLDCKNFEVLNVTFEELID